MAKNAIPKTFTLAASGGRRRSRGNDVTAPVAPILLDPVAGVGQISVAWTNGIDADSGISETAVEYRLNGAVEWTEFARYDYLAETSTVITGLLAPDAYDVRVTTYDNASPPNSASSNIRTVLTLASTNDAEPGIISVSATPIQTVANFQLQIPVTRASAGSLSSAVEVDWQFQNLFEGTPSPANGTLSWAAGENGDKTVTVTVGNTQVQRSGTFRLTTVRSAGGGLLPALGNTTVTVSVASASALPTIADIVDAGYVDVTSFAGVRNDGLGNPATVRAGLQAAIDFANANRRPTFWPNQTDGSRGIYVVDDTLRWFQWQPYNSSTGNTGSPPDKPHTAVGASVGGVRPVIKLAQSAPLFDGTPRPVVCFRMLRGMVPSATGAPIPSDPLSNPSGWQGYTANYYNIEFRGIDVDTNHHSGAIGVYSTGTQDTGIHDVTVTATDSYAAFKLLPTLGANSNLKAIGGQYSWDLSSNLAGDGGQLINAFGIEAIDPTVAVFKSNIAGPITVAGFRFARSTPGSLIVMNSSNLTATGTLNLIDGQLEMTSGLAIDNTVDKNLYLRNVYVTGTNSLVKSGGSATITGSGTWKLINEYASTDPTAPGSYPLGSGQFKTWNVIGGVKATTHEISSISNDVAAPPSDLRTRHTFDFPYIDEAPFVDVRDYGAVTISDSEIKRGISGLYGGNESSVTDALTAFTNAIAAAETAGHNRVLVPRGNWYVGSPGVNLKANTKLFGLGRQMSNLLAHGTWRPTSGTPFLVTTDSNATSSAFLGQMSISPPTTRGGNGSASSADTMDRFGYFHWRLGKGSAIASLRTRNQFHSPDLPTNAYAAMQYSGNAGGKMYGLTQDNHWGSANTGFRTLKLVSTTQPLWFYGINTEFGKENVVPATNMEMTGCSNVRILGWKREGRSPSVQMTDCSNIAFYGGGAMRAYVTPSYIDILGTSTNILVAGVYVQSTQTDPIAARYTLRDQSINVAWPEGVSLYKRGTINDTAAYTG